MVITIVIHHLGEDDCILRCKPFGTQTRIEIERGNKSLRFYSDCSFNPIPTPISINNVFEPLINTFLT
jgi:hypothetical protein